MKLLKFVTINADDCVFRRGSVWILLYVDDLILMSPMESELTKVKREIEAQLDIRDLGTLRHFLGVTFQQHGDGAWLSQHNYISQVLNRFGMSERKPVATPMNEEALREMQVSESEAVDRGRYQELLVCRLFLSTRTRPDISAAIAILCRNSAEPTSV